MPGLLQAWMTAIGTSSSSVTLPITFNCVEEDLNVDRRVSRFVISIGSAVNMDGTALCMAVAAIFIAQLNGVEMSFLRVISVRFIALVPKLMKRHSFCSFTVTLAAMCSAGVPSAGLILVLTSMGLPIGDVSLLLLADRILDRVRESINVVGNAFGAVIINHHVKEDLLAYDVLHANDFDLNGK
ncbi:hypothetical protein KIN20_008162 [Parelaphostrongylus tenuis]|uniref:Amino acid transporter n=2 Tax=Parelaphostrongylus tenuis TaxID=148309 RepID=A0AAD5MQS1_PARTN|nr:hypothetical protein KIN20_008162 [Parelaphostrongylus tenuis]